jgi:hypothetical protein
LAYRDLVPDAPYTAWHVKPTGEELPLRGRIAGFAHGLLALARTFSPGGRFDTLHVPKLAGDTGTHELLDGGCVCRRTYARASGEPLGELYNVNTPV